MSRKSIVAAVWLGLWVSMVGFHETAIGFVECSKYFDDSYVPFEPNHDERLMLMRAAIDFRANVQKQPVHPMVLEQAKRNSVQGFAVFSFGLRSGGESDTIQVPFRFGRNGMRLAGIIGGSGVWELIQDWGDTN